MTALVGKYRAAIKRISSVEASRYASNQHELNGSAALRSLFGEEKRTGFESEWILLTDSGEPTPEGHLVSWYDSREGNPDRAAEWRLYYEGEPPLAEGRLLVAILRDGDPTPRFLVADKGSTWEAQLIGLFGAPSDRAGTFIESRFESIPEPFSAVAADLFGIIGWSERVAPSGPTYLDLLRQRFGHAFPSTAAFSALARELAPPDLGDPDGTLFRWWQREEALFQTFEEEGLRTRLDLRPPFRTVEDFLSFSLSVQNRRKSRAGHALEHHVAALFKLKNIRHTKNGRTEEQRSPDFILPGAAYYHDRTFPTDLLTILGVKTTCKDRWRQVLSEASRVRSKHLLTLEAGISAHQLSEMKSEDLTLVAPKQIRSTYTIPAGMNVLTVDEFVRLAEERQRKSPL